MTKSIKFIEQENEQLSAKILMQKREIEDLNRTLNLILSSIEQEKSAIKDKIYNEMSTLVFPQLENLIEKNQTKNELIRKVREVENRIVEILSGSSTNLFLIHNRLTSKEIEICNLLVQGMKGKEIANDLGISYLTLRTHTRNIRKKLMLSRGQNLSHYLYEMMK